MSGAAPDGGLLEHLQAEHHKLNCRLSAIQHRIDDPSTSGAARQSSDFVAALNALRAELMAHFAEEEIDGCLGEATARCPSVAGQLKAIHADHEALLKALDELIGSAADATDAGPLSRGFRTLSDRLHAHETAETRLLEYALGGEVADYDVEGND